MSDDNLEELVVVVRKLREAKADLNKRLDEIKVAEKNALQAVLNYLDEHGLESARTDSGTAYAEENVVYNVEDWSAFYEWVLENEALDALQKRISTTFVREHLEASGELLPGLNPVTLRTAQVRRR